MITAPIVIVWLVCGIAAGMIGQSKGHSFGYYFLWGVLFGPIGLIVALAVKPARPTVKGPQPIMGLPGWLIDPYDTRYVRYWDGTRWTNEVQPRR